MTKPIDRIRELVAEALPCAIFNDGGCTLAQNNHVSHGERCPVAYRPAVEAIMRKLRIETLTHVYELTGQCPSGECICDNLICETLNDPD